MVDDKSLRLARCSVLDCNFSVAVMSEKGLHCGGCDGELAGVPARPGLLWAGCWGARLPHGRGSSISREHSVELALKQVAMLLLGAEQGRVIRNPSFV